MIDLLKPRPKPSERRQQYYDRINPLLAKAEKSRAKVKPAAAYFGGVPSGFYERGHRYLYSIEPETEILSFERKWLDRMGVEYYWLYLFEHATFFDTVVNVLRKTMDIHAFGIHTSWIWQDTFKPMIIPNQLAFFDEADAVLIQCWLDEQYQEAKKARQK